jgi:hypothetical protein
MKKNVSMPAALVALGLSIAATGACAGGKGDAPVIATLEESRACDALDDSLEVKNIELQAMQQVHERVLAQMQVDNDHLTMVRRNLDRTSHAEVEAYNAGVEILRGRDKEISTHGQRTRQLTEDYNRAIEKRNKRCAALVLQGDDADVAHAERDAHEKLRKEKSEARMAAAVAQAEQEVADLLQAAVLPTPAAPPATPRAKPAKDAT